MDAQSKAAPPRTVAAQSAGVGPMSAPTQRQGPSFVRPGEQLDNDAALRQEIKDLQRKVRIMKLKRYSLNTATLLLCVVPFVLLILI